MLTVPFSLCPWITDLDQLITMKINSAKKTIHMRRDQARYIFTMTVWLDRMMLIATAGKYSITGIFGAKKCIPKLVFLCRILFHLGELVILIFYASKTHKCYKGKLWNYYFYV